MSGPTPDYSGGYVVVGTSPVAEVPVVCGPYPTVDAAMDAASILTSRGYVADAYPLQPLSEVDYSADWSDEA